MVALLDGVLNLLLLQNVGIKINCIYIYHSNARLLLVYSFLFNNVDHTAPSTPAYIFKIVELSTFVTPLSICQESSQFVFLSKVFTFSLHGECVCCWFLSVCLPSFSTIPSNLFVSYKLLITTVWAPWTSTLFPRLADFHYVC